MMSEQARQTRDEGTSLPLGIPVLILALAFFLYTANQTYEVISAANLLSTARSNQEGQLKEVDAIRRQTNGLANDAADLARAGNAAAREAVEALAKQGIIKFAPPPGQQQPQPPKK